MISPGSFESFVPPRAHPKTAEELSERQLVQSKQLTKYRAGNLSGPGHALILGNYTILERSAPAAWGRCSRPSIAA